MTMVSSSESEVNCCTKAPGTCNTCGTEKQWVDCYNCGGEGYSDHDCGEDCCCCLNPENNVTCDICEGEGDYKVCLHCHPDAGE